MSEKLRFKAGSNRPTMDMDALTNFVENAKGQPPSPASDLQLPRFVGNGKRSETILFRCSKADFDDIAFVFKSINVKSRQNLIESILIPEVRRLAVQLRIQGHV